jgi:ribosomal protein S18 acetylase RimI-like enzyme
VSNAKYRIEPLTDHHDRAGFRCGVDALDRYFLTQAGQDTRRRVASCFVLVADGKTISGYFTLSATNIALTDLPQAVAKKLPRYPVLPATLMGRLAIDERCRGEGLGGLLLLDAFNRALRSEIATFAFVVDPKDERAQAFYTRYRFLPLQNSSRRMFLPLSEIAALFA